MENAVDALKMAAAILVFILAFVASFSLFGTAKQTADSIITMRDKQAYLTAAELDNGILYTSSSAIQGNLAGLTEEEIEAQKKEESTIGGVTKNGDRIVTEDDVISTIYRYSKEKYGVTIVEEENGDVLARFSTSTESYVANYNAYSDEWWTAYTDLIAKNIETDYVTTELNFGIHGIQDLYNVTYKSGYTGSGYDAKWLGNDRNIQERIKVDIYGGNFTKDGVIYQGENINERLKGRKIVEVTNEIDTSKYLKDGTENTNLLQEYQIPTVEIVYIILN